MGNIKAKLFSAYSWEISENGIVGKFPLGYYKFRIYNNDLVSNNRFIEVELIGKTLKSVFSKDFINSNTNDTFSIYGKEESNGFVIATTLGSNSEHAVCYLIENSSPLISLPLDYSENIKTDENKILTLKFGDGYYEQPIAAVLKSEDSRPLSVLKTNKLSNAGSASVNISSNNINIANNTEILTNNIKNGRLKGENVIYSQSGVNAFIPSSDNKDIIQINFLLNGDDLEKTMTNEHSDIYSNVSFYDRPDGKKFLL